MLDTIALFTKSHGVYKDKFKFRVILVFCITLIVFSRLFGDDYYKIIILIFFGFVVTEVYTSTQSNFVSDYNEETMEKLGKLQGIMDKYIKSELVKGANNIAPISQDYIAKTQKQYMLDSMYMDANMIEFLYSIKDLSRYNLQQFYKILKGTNNIMSIHRQLEDYYVANGIYLENTSNMLKIAMNLKVNLLNNLHDMIYTVPKTEKMSVYLYDSLKIYDKLLDGIIQQIHKAYKIKLESDGINSNTVLVDYPGVTKSAYDTTPGRGYRYII